jgi:hypothetical protein
MRHHGGAAEALSELGFGDPLVLVREPTNAYDENAIQVFTLTHILLGYIAREYASDWAPVFDLDGTPVAHLTFSSSGHPRVEVEFGDEEDEEDQPQEESA